MKLRNKLIPLMSAVGTACVVAPMVTSCNIGKSMVDITTSYISKYERAKALEQKYTLQEAQDLYFSKVMENTDLIKDEILTFESAYLPTRIQEIENEIGGYYLGEPVIVNSVKAKVGVSGTKISKHTAVIEEHESKTKTDVNFYTISMTLSYDFEFTALNEDGTFSITSKTTLTNEMNEIPVFLVAVDSSDRNYFYVTSSLGEHTVYKDRELTMYYLQQYYNYVPGWSMTLNYNNVETLTSISEVKEVQSETYEDNFEGTINRLSQMTYEMLYWLYYENVTLDYRSNYMLDIEPEIN